MSFTGYDSEAIGFDSSAYRSRTREMDSSTQTTEFGESGVGSQTKIMKDCGSNTEVVTGEVSVYPPAVPGLNEFLRRVVPGVLEQLDKKNEPPEVSILDVSSDSEEEDLLLAKLFQELDMKTSPSGAGDNQPENILSVTWSSAGYSLAVSIGRLFHEEWCQHEGLIKIFTVKRSDGDKFTHSLDITEKNCVTAVKYHPSVAALLAYGTSLGDVVLCNLRCNLGSKDFQLTSPTGSHNSVRISSLKWADSPLTNIFLVMQIQDKRIRRGASDQVLISAAADGTINVWQVNACNQTFQNIICYSIGSKTPGPEITCFDFIKIYPLRPSDEKYLDDIFVVGTKTGKLFLCNMKEYNQIPGGTMVDPVYDVLEGHSTCVLDVAFSFQKTNIFASVSMDSEIRVYNVEQNAPIKVLCMDDMLTSIGWAPNNPCLLIAGLAKVGKKGQLLKVYNVSSGREIPIQGLKGTGGDDGVSVSALDVNQSGVCRVAAGDTAGRVHLWDLPIRRVKLTPDDLDF